MNRITKRDIEGAISALNRLYGYRDDRQEGSFSLGMAYGGYRLERRVGSGISTVTGYLTKRELLQAINAMRYVMEARTPAEFAMRRAVSGAIAERGAEPIVGVEKNPGAKTGRMEPHEYTQVATHGKWTVCVAPSRNYGYFEHEDYGEGGGLWFKTVGQNTRLRWIKELVDFDGVMMLPTPVAMAIQKLGYHVPNDFVSGRLRGNEGVHGDGVTENPPKRLTAGPYQFTSGRTPKATVPLGRLEEVVSALAAQGIEPGRIAIKRNLSAMGGPGDVVHIFPNATFVSNMIAKERDGPGPYVWSNGTKWYRGGQ